MKRSNCFHLENGAVALSWERKRTISPPSVLVCSCMLGSDVSS
eukprot:CAMPEP_0172468842 /NCGR_PEP_ID=MMETSP1065-20121228/62233_1 /TAXON_ID=265537 /ORGANISM="Amphiprora paludosa, Strain CCMP125" /LENGTH=42 /DNA_ID= /DNA_START= /DNA_END= /DNA_ORIENTATION=